MGLSDQDGITQDTPDQLGLEGVRTESAVMMEGIIGPDSSLAGKSLKDLNFRQRFGVLILGVHRQSGDYRRNFDDVRIHAGDSLLIEGPPQAISRVQTACP